MSACVARDPQPLPLTVVVRSGATVIRQGTPGDGLWIVRSGALRAASITHDGRELVHGVVGPGEGVGEPEGLTSAVTVRALRPSRLTPASPETTGHVLAMRAHLDATLLSELAWLDVRSRVRRRLTDLAMRFGRPVEGGRLILLPLTQDEVAALAGTTRESANRALRSLVADGAIRIAARGRYVVRTGLRVAEGADGAEASNG